MATLTTSVRQSTGMASQRGARPRHSIAERAFKAIGSLTVGLPVGLADRDKPSLQWKLKIGDAEGVTSTVCHRHARGCRGGYACDGFYGTLQ